MYKELTLVVGLPGCGKSTYCKNFINSIIIDVDNFRRSFTGSQYIHELENYLKEIVKNIIRGFCYNSDIEQRIVLVDSAWLIHKEGRKEWIRFAKNLEMNIRCVYIKEDLKICKQRNEQREKRRIVPSHIMDLLWDMFEPPDEKEGIEII